MLLEREGGETALRDAKALIENLKQNVGRKQSECARKKSDKSKRKDQRRSISIVVADDHPVVLHGLADVLRSNSDMKVVAVCSDGATALEAIRKWSPNVAVLDIFMPGLTGLDVLASIAAASLATQVGLLAATASDEHILRAI